MPSLWNKYVDGAWIMDIDIVVARELEGNVNVSAEDVELSDCEEGNDESDSDSDVEVLTDGDDSDFDGGD